MQSLFSGYNQSNMDMEEICRAYVVSSFSLDRGFKMGKCECSMSLKLPLKHLVFKKMVVCSKLMKGLYQGKATQREVKENMESTK